MQTLWQDLVYGVRILAKNRGFTLIVVLTLALGIGANTALFSVVDGVLLKPLPFRNPDRIIALFEHRLEFERASISYPNFLDWQRENRTFDALAAFRPDDFSLTGAGQAEKVHADMVSAEFFSILGVRLAAGREFSHDEDRQGAGPVAVITSGFWKRKFGSAPDIVGSRVALDGTDYTIVGVLPANFHLSMWNFQDADVFVTIGQWNDVLFHDRDTAMGMDAIGRLKPGVTLAQAKADLGGIAARLATTYPQTNVGVGVTLIPLKDSMVGEIKPFLLVLFAAVGFVLLIACVNVANLLLARATVRAREFAIRTALGASRSRVIRQLLTESVLLSILGGGLGLILAAWGTQAAVGLLPQHLPRAEAIGFDGRVFVFAAAISIISGILFGLAPARRTAQPGLRTTLQEGGRGMSVARHRAQGVFVAMEMAMAMILLIGAGLMIRSLLACGASTRDLIRVMRRLSRCTRADHAVPVPRDSRHAVASRWARNAGTSCAWSWARREYGLDRRRSWTAGRAGIDAIDVRLAFWDQRYGPHHLFSGGVLVDLGGARRLLHSRAASDARGSHRRTAIRIALPQRPARLPDSTNKFMTLGARPAWRLRSARRRWRWRRRALLCAGRRVGARPCLGPRFSPVRGAERRRIRASG